MELIKTLRDRTGAGMVECKKALDESGNDIEKAIEILRKKGIAKAAKRGDRETSEGIVLVTTDNDNTEGYIMELDSETDFVSRNDKFQAFANEAMALIKTDKPESLEALYALQMADGLALKESLEILSGTIGEKLELKRFEIVSGATVAAYSHAGGRIGVLVVLDAAGKKDLAGDIAMQVAAANPRYINSDEVPAAEIEAEKAIYREQLLKEGKPEAMIEKIAEGKINKFFSEICLAKQEFIKDDKQSVEAILAGTKITKFVRYSL